MTFKCVPIGRFRWRPANNVSGPTGRRHTPRKNRKRCYIEFSWHLPNPGDVVLDPFFGSGTTGAVAKKLGRNWIGIERDKKYIKVAQKRIDAVQMADEESLHVEKRKQARVPFGALLENGLLKSGANTLFCKERHEGERSWPTGICVAETSPAVFTGSLNPSWGHARKRLGRLVL